MKNAIYINDLHFEHEQWKSELDFQKDKLNIFKNRLEEVASKWTKHDVLAKVEHYQNSFIRHKEVIDTIEHNINGHESKLTQRALANPTAIHHEHFKDHTGLREEMETQRKLFTELNTEFFRFLTEVM